MCLVEHVIFYCDYWNRSPGTEETIKIVESIDSLFSMIDRILLEHPNVYKIEGVGNCYMVASGLPKVGNTHYAMERNVMRIISDLQKSMHHAVHMAQFCYQLMRLCNSRGEIDYSLGSTDTIPMHIQGGIHCGEVTAAVVGQSRSFYRCACNCTITPNVFYIGDFFIQTFRRHTELRFPCCQCRNPR